MGPAKRIKGYVILVLLSFCVSGCETGPCLAPEWEYTVVRFIDEDYKNYTLTVLYLDSYYVFTYGAYEKDFLGYFELRDHCYMSKQITIPKNCAVSTVKWEDFSVSGHGLKFSQEEIMNVRPLSACYKIPETKLGVPFAGPSASPEAIDSINAMIDDGRIERYRVDLGY